MADNVAITAGSGTTIAADDVGGVLHQRVKISQGADGVAADVSSSAPLQVTLANTAANTNKLLVTPDLPSGASTAAKQPALGTAGAASTDVITVQGIASGTAQPISGTVTINAIPAGSNAIGKLAANTGVTIGAVEIAASQTVGLVAGSAIVGKAGIDQTTPGTTNAVALSTLGTTAVDGNSGNKSAGTLRVVLATDQPALTNPLLTTLSAGSVSHIQRADTADAVAASATVNNIAVIGRPTVFNGTTWDRQYGPVIKSVTVTRPANTTAYTAADIVANSATAGSVSFGTYTIETARRITGARLKTTNTLTNIDLKQFRVRLWNAAPAYTNGDNVAYVVTTGAAGYLGKFEFTMEGFTDGGAGSAAPFDRSEILVGPASTIYWDLQTIDGFTPSANSTTFTLELELAS